MSQGIPALFLLSFAAEPGDLGQSVLDGVSRWSDLRLWFGVAGLFVFLFGAAWLLVRSSRHGMAGRSSTRLRVLEHLPISRDASVALVQAGDRQFLIGVTKSGVSLLGELSGGAALSGAEQAAPSAAVWPVNPLSDLTALFERKPAVTSTDGTHPSFAALLQTIRDQDAEPSGPPAAEPAGSGDDRSGQSYDSALQQLDALGRWRTTSADKLDNAMDRIATRAERYGRRDGR